MRCLLLPPESAAREPHKAPGNQSHLQVGGHEITLLSIPIGVDELLGRGPRAVRLGTIPVANQNQSPRMNHCYFPTVEDRLPVASAARRQSHRRRPLTRIPSVVGHVLSERARRATLNGRFTGGRGMLGLGTGISPVAGWTGTCGYLLL